MFADGPWEHAAVEAYARLLRLPGAHAVIDAASSVPCATDRGAYFAKLIEVAPPNADLLIDPDTGIKARPTSSTAHVSVAELGTMLAHGRILMVFDESHDRRIEKSVHVRGLAGALVGLGAHIVACESGRGVTMFFVSRDAPRAKAIQESLARLLGPASQRRGTAYP
jgi:hypothetical protein